MTSQSVAHFHQPNAPESSIQVSSCTLTEVFAGEIPVVHGKKTIRGKLTIPVYQRPYLWGAREVDRLVDDIVTHRKAKTSQDYPQYYLGTIILQQSSDGHLNIIDGQQRVITMALIQAENGLPIPDLCITSPISIERIKNNVAYIRQYERDLLCQINPNEINITLVITRREDDAYTFFETQNTGGVRLNGVDIIKAHHLRAIPVQGGRQDTYAHTWEAQRSLPELVVLLLKARRWNLLRWQQVPPEKDLKGIKTAIISDFSEAVKPDGPSVGYLHVISQQNQRFQLPAVTFAIRQPLNSGANFIDYLQAFGQVYHRLFREDSDPDIPDEYYTFRKEIIDVIDGTAFLRDFFQISMLCYVSRFGFEHIWETALWLFRYTYAPRLINKRTVREDSIPAFIRSDHYLIDHILQSFTHEEFIEYAKRFSYDVNSENLNGNTVKKRFLNRVAVYFNEFSPGFEGGYDFALLAAIKAITKENSL